MEKAKEKREGIDKRMSIIPTGRNGRQRIYQQRTG